MKYGSTPYVGLALKKHGRHTLGQTYFCPITNDTVQLETFLSDFGTF